MHMERKTKESLKDFTPSNLYNSILFQPTHNQYLRESIKLAPVIQNQYIKNTKLAWDLNKEGLHVFSKITMRL